jgi:hypothetical protein
MAHQKILYKGEELSYKFNKSIFRRYEEASGKNAEQSFSGRAEDTILLLYFCICWTFRVVSQVEFMEAYKNGGIRFSAFHHHYSFWEFRGLAKSYYFGLQFILR